MSLRRKVFCVGLQKTGTSSMRDALELLGYRVAGKFGGDLDYPALRASYVATGLEVAAQHDAVEDMPWPLMVAELDAAFPDARFVLTIRDEDSWYRSISSHFGGNGAPLQMLTYGEDAPSPAGHEQRYRAVYRAHNAAVRAMFADRPDRLVEMDLARGDGWAELCGLIGVGVPRRPFPVTNTAQQRATLTNRVRGKLHKLGLPVKRLDR